MDELKAENLQLTALVNELQERIEIERMKYDALWRAAVELAKERK